MGKEVVYCFNCGTRLVEADFEKGKAHRIGSEVSCPECLPTLLEMIPPEERAKYLKPGAPTRATASIRKTGVIRRATSAVPKVKPGETPEEEDEKRPGSKKKVLLLAGGGGAALIAVVVVLIVALGGKKEPVPSEKGASATPEPPSSAAGRSREVLAREALARAIAYRDAHPEDVQGQAAEFSDIAHKFADTSAATEAKKEVDRLRAVPAAGGNSELSQMIRAAVDQENFKQAIDLLVQAKDRKPGPAWIREVDAKIEEVRADVEKRYAELKKKAEDAKARNAADELKSIRERVATWGLDDVVERFDDTFKTAPAAAAAVNTAAAPKERSAEGKAYLDRWMAAVAPATKRDYAGALAELKKASEGLKEDPWKREAAEDAKDVKAVEAMYKAALQVAAKLPPGKRGSFDVLTSSGGKESMEAIVVWSDADRVELRRPDQKETFYVEPAEFGPVTLSVLFTFSGRNKPADLRAAGLFLLLEGESEAAKKLGVADLPDKYAEYAKGAAGRGPTPSAEVRREREARRLFWAAARDFRRLDTIGNAIEKYKLLATEYAGASIVAKDIVQVTKRSEMGKEYVFLAGDLVGSGEMQLRKHPDLGYTWACDSDVTIEALVKETYVEISFYALPGADYKCWVYAGACCEETFGCWLQATDLKAKTGKRGEEISCEPDSKGALPVDHRIRNLKKEHQGHGDKQPSRWEWMNVQIPKFAKPGPKQVRIISDQKGFSVAMAIVSSQRKAPPRATEMEDERRKAAEDADGRLDLAAGLLVHWTLDEAAGKAVDDKTGRGHKGTVNGNAKKSGDVPAEIKAGNGGSLEFDGKGDFVETAAAPDLSMDWSDFTISAWVNLSKDDPMRLVNKWNGKMGWLVDLNTNAKGAKAKGQVRVKLNDGKNDVDHAVIAHVPTGGKEWAHVVVTVDRRARDLRVYVDGAQVGNQRNISGLSEGLANTATLGVGAIPIEKKNFIAGRVDDVRLYARALSPAEIQALSRPRK